MIHARSAALVTLVVTALAVAGCSPAPASSTETAPPQGASPLDNTDGMRPGLGPLSTPGDRRAAANLIALLKTAAPGPKSGYNRDKFGPAWSDDTDQPFGHNACETRQDILNRDGTAVTRASGSACTVTAMSLYDPYTAATVRWNKDDAAKVQIDHVVPLSYSWQMGSAAWSDAKRRRLANDPLNLLAVTGSQNASKGDSGPSQWLPTSSSIGCAYTVRFTQVALKYDLPVQPADKTAMARTCSARPVASPVRTADSRKTRSPRPTTAGAKDKPRPGR